MSFELSAESLHPTPFTVPEHELTMRGPWLLGVDCADIPHRENVYQVINIAGQDEDMATDYVAYSNSGQMAVIPSWQLREFLDKDERFVMQRKKAEKQAEQKRNAPLRPNTMKKESRPSGITKRGFDEALRRASRKVSEPKSGKKEE